MNNSNTNIKTENHVKHETKFPDAENGTLISILNSLAEGVIVSDKTGKFLYFNPIAKKILGIGIKNVDTAEWSATYGCYYPDKVTPFPSEQLPLARALQNEDVFDEVIYILNPERPEGVFIEVSSRPIRNRDGEVAGGTVIIRDITESIRLKEIQQQNEARIKAQFNGIPIPTYVWQFQHNDFYLIDYNEAANLFTNNAIKKMLGTRLRELYPDFKDVNEDFNKCYQQKTIITREMDYQFKSTGVIKSLNVRYVHVPPDLVLVHTEDITEHKRTESESHKLFNAVEQTADSVIITNSRGVIEYVNPAFEITTGYSREEAIGNTPNMLKSGMHDAAFYQNLWDILQSGKPYLGQIVNRKKNGELYWSEQTITPMKDNSDEITNYVSVLKDITELRARQEQEFQLNMAREIQQKLLCTGISIPGFDIFGKTYSAVETSGDFYDFIRLPDGSFGFIVGDVSGHGVGSALIMAQTRAYLRAFVKIEADPGVLLTRLNQELEADLEAELYVTMIFLRLDPNKMQFNYVNAGHVSGYLMKKNGVVREELESNGIPLGILKQYQYETSRTFPLRHDDILILLSDGIMEAHALDNTEFGVNQTIDVIRQHRNQSASAIVQHIYAEVNRFCGNQPQEDDITSIICKVTGNKSS